jgi:gliding motility-associated-like protein
MALAVRMPAQIYAPAASYSFYAKYNPPGGTDSVFIFNRPAYKAEITTSIVAASIDSTPGWTFQWSVFDPLDTSYNALPATDTGMYSKIDTISISSGYQVEMIRGAERDTFRIWLLINDLDLRITNKDAENKLKFGYYKCSSLDLHADTTRIPLFYYNPESGKKLDVDNNYIIRWTTDNEEASSPPSRLITRVTNPPSEDTWYVLTLTDKFGLERSDSVFYESIQSKADINEEYVSLSDPLEYPKNYLNYDKFYDSLSYSAPGKYRFDVSGSRNMASYEINFGDGNVFNSVGDILKVIHEYEKPDTFTVVLTTKSDKPYECTDSTSVKVLLKYADAENFKIPNIFTPNGDNSYIFRSEDVSVTFIDITIFNRAGWKVHSYAGNIRDWEGWDGNLKNGLKAPDGVYFYVISMFSAYEDKDKPIGKKVMKGFFHLYRK